MSQGSLNRIVFPRPIRITCFSAWTIARNTTLTHKSAEFMGDNLGPNSWDWQISGWIHMWLYSSTDGYHSRSAFRSCLIIPAGLGTMRFHFKAFHRHIVHKLSKNKTDGDCSHLARQNYVFRWFNISQRYALHRPNHCDLSGNTRVANYNPSTD